MNVYAKINGIKASHAIVAPECRIQHGIEKAGELAVKQLLEEYMEAISYPANKKARFHFVLTVER